MKKYKLLIAAIGFAIVVLGLWYGFQENKLEDEMAVPSGWIVQEIETKASFRGISVVDDQVIWVSGSQGTVLRSADAGASWDVNTVPGAEELDFRDIHGVDESTAYIISAGLPAKIFKTTDGGKSWQEQYSNETPGIFFDSFDFWDADHGIALSDPIGKHSYLIFTADGGSSWQELSVDGLPEIMEGEACYAASGTCLITGGENDVWYCTGGQVARVFHSADRGATWQVSETGLITGLASTGNFGIGFKDLQIGVVVGGDYKNESSDERNAAFTTDGGATWTLVEENKPGGFRECAKYIPNTENSFVTVGPSGSDYSTDGGKSWNPFGELEGLHTMDISSTGRAAWATGRLDGLLSSTGGAAWAAGRDGLVAKLDFSKEAPEKGENIE